MSVGQYLVEVGKDKSGYKVKYSFTTEQQSRAFFYYDCLNTHSGYKKRLVRVNADGTRRVIHRTIT